VKIDIGFHQPNFILSLHSKMTFALIHSGWHFNSVNRNIFKFHKMSLFFDPGVRALITKCLDLKDLTMTGGSLVCWSELS